MQPTRRAAAARAAAIQPISGAHDPARFFAGGPWDCRTLAGIPEEHRYVVTGNGFDLHTLFSLKGRRVQLDEYYRFDRRTQRWTVTLANGAYVASAGPWNGPLWTFTGSMGAGANPPFVVRMMYQYFDERAFRRDFQVRQQGDWTTSSAETCLRAQAPST